MCAACCVHVCVTTYGRYNCRQKKKNDFSFIDAMVVFAVNRRKIDVAQHNIARNIGAIKKKSIFFSDIPQFCNSTCWKTRETYMKITSDVTTSCYHFQICFLLHQPSAVTAIVGPVVCHSFSYVALVSRCKCETNGEQYICECIYVWWSRSRHRWF